MLRKDDKIQKKIFPYEFPVEMETRAHGNIVARCPQLPGCQAQGKTTKEALENLKTAIDLYFTSATPAFFESLEQFNGIHTIYDLEEFRGYLYAATGQDAVLRSSNGAPGSFTLVPVTNVQAKFFTPAPGAKEGEGGYTTQIYCLCPYAPPGREKALFAGTNVNGAIYVTLDGEKWVEAFSTGEDRIHALCEFKNRLYAGTSSRGRIFAFDGIQWNTVGSLSEVGITCLGVFKGRLYAGTYPSGLIFSTPDGLNWEEVTGTGQNFIQSMKEFNGAFYAGTSSPKGVKIYRTENGNDWVMVYETARELNLYCFEVFENALYAGTGNSGRVLKSQDGINWKTAYAGDEEGVRSFAVFGDYLFAGTENRGALLRSTFDMARMPVITELSVEKLSSSSALLTWATDISATSEVQYGEKAASAEFPKVIQDRSLQLRHRVHMTDLKAETEYEFKVISAYRSSSLSVTETSSFTTKPVEPPSLSSPSHPQTGKWERKDQVEILFHPTVPLSGYYYLLNHYPETVPTLPEAVYTDEKRVALTTTPQGSWYFHVVGVDEAGNVGNKASHYRVQIDTEAAPPPAVSSSTHPAPEKWVANSTPVILWEKPKDLSGVMGYFVKADHEPTTVPGPGAGEFTTENRITLGPLEDGLWYVHVSTQDEAGNVGSQAAHFPVRVDTKALAPALASNSHPQPEQWYSNNQADVMVSAPHDLSGVEGYHYCLDREPQTLPDPETAQWTTKGNITFPDLKDGIWYVHVRTQDKAGNLSPQAAHLKILVDTQAAPPLVTSPTHPFETHSTDSTSSPLAGSGQAARWYKDRRVVLTWEDPFEHSGIEGYFYNIDRKADTVPNVGTALFTNQRTVSFELTDDGLWYFHITSKDKAGNVDWKAEHYPLHVDTSVEKPFLSSATHPDEHEWYRAPKLVLKLTPPDDLSGVTGYYYTFSEDPKLVPDPKTATFTDRSEVILDIPRDGVHLFSALCQDAAGNISRQAAVFRVRLDTQTEAPQVSSPSHPDPQKWYGSRRLVLTWKDPADLSGIEGFYFTFNQEENTAPDPKAMTWTSARATVFTLPEDGTWFAHVCAKDKAGNIGPCAHFKAQADTQAVLPTVKSPTHPANQWVKVSTPQFLWDAPRELSGVEGYYVAIDAQAHTVPVPGNGKWVTENALTGPSLKDGQWFFHLTTKDMVGNVSKEAAHYPFWIDTTAPKSQMKPLPSILDKTQVFVEWSASDTGSGIVSYDVQVKAGETGPWTDWLTDVSEKSGVYTGKDGFHYSFRCRARDYAGNAENYPEGEMAATTIDISPPAAVTTLKATPRAAGDVELRWNPVADEVSGTAYYRIYRWLEGEKKQKISTDGEVKEPSYLDKGEALKENTVYYYCVQAVDQMGNEQHEGNGTAASLSDHSVGEPVISSPTHSSEDWSSNSSPLLVWTAPADATGIEGYYYLLDQSPSSKVTPENGAFTDGRRLELSDLQSGIWYFHLAAKDKAGNISEQAARYRLKIDVEKPEAPHVVSPGHPDGERWYSSNKVEFKLSSAPKLSGMDGYYYLFDQDPGTVVTLEGAQRTTEPDLALRAAETGVWYLHVAAKDKAGNVSPPTHFRVLLATGELPPPVVASPTHPREDEPTNHHDPVFSWEDRHDGSFKIAGYVYKLSADEKEVLTAEDQFTTEKSAQIKDVGEGTWYFHVAAVGKKGKPGLLSSKRRVVIQRLGKVSGTFLRKDGVTPIQGTKVEMLRGDKPAAAAMTDTQGKFRFSGLPQGRYEIRLHSDQFPVLRVKDIPVSPEVEIQDAVFTEDLGIFPTPPGPGPIRFYYALKEDCNVTLEVFDASGALVQKVTDKKEGGAYNVTLWDATGKPEGEYLYKLSAKSITKNAMSRFSVKKFRITKPSKELAAQTVS